MLMEVAPWAMKLFNRWARRGYIMPVSQTYSLVGVDVWEMRPAVGRRWDSNNIKGWKIEEN